MTTYDFTERTAAWKSISGRKWERPLSLNDGNFRLFCDLITNLNDNGEVTTSVETIYHDYNSEGKVLNKDDGHENREPISGHLDNILGGWIEPFARAKPIMESVTEVVEEPLPEYMTNSDKAFVGVVVGGRKDDQEKAAFHLLAPELLEDVSAVLTFGAKKYSERNWEKGMDWNRPFAALMRHMWAWWKGENNDEETGLSHLAHAACCIMFLLAYERRNIGKDNRPNA